MRELTVIDLFAGIGGFSYGLHNASPRFKTIAFAEIDEFCWKVLKKNFGNVKIYEDVRDVRIEQPVFLVCGGFPCQGFSHAGLQRGTKDNRYLWPEMFDVIKHTKPRWVIAENVRGIVNVEDGVAFNKVHTDLESQGYEVQAFNIPASAKGAWHRRERIWFVACNPDVVYPHDFRCEQHTEAEEKGNGRAEATSFSGGSHASDSESERTGEPGEPHKEKGDTKSDATQSNGSSSNVPDTSIKGLQRHNKQPSKQTRTLTRQNKRKFDVPDSNEGDAQAGRERQRGVCEKDKVEGQPDNAARPRQALPDSNSTRPFKKHSTTISGKNEGNGFKHEGGGREEECQGDWSEIIAQFRGVPDGVSTELDKTRTSRLKSLGNAIVPQIAETIGRAIIKAERKYNG